MIHELLATGSENARTGRELAAVLGCGLRDITIQIERERRDGHPICATTGDRPGYYMAANATELQRYCRRLYRRSYEITKTRRALQNALLALQAKEAQRR